MSGMRFWAPQLLFMWQLLWLLVQARPLPELALDPNLLTTTTLGLTEPWPQDQQNLAEEPSYTAGEVEFPSQKEVSALQTESSEEEEEEPIEVPPKKGSTTPQVHFASAELSAGNEEGPAQPPEIPEAALLHPKPAQAQQPTPPAIAVESLDLGLIITPRPMEEAAQPTTLQHTTVSPEIPEVTPPHPEPSEVPEEEEEEPIEVPPKKGSTTPQMHFASAELSAGNEEGPAQPPEIPEATLLHPKPAQAQQPTPPAIAVESVDLGLTITPRPVEEAEQPTTLQHTTAPPEHPAVTPPYPGPAQAQQPTPPAIAVESVDLGLIITPRPMEEAEQPTTLQHTTAPPEHSAVTPFHPGPAQAQQPTPPAIAVESVDLGLTITPRPMEEAEQPTTLQHTTAPPEHPAVTPPYPGPAQAQQPTSPAIVVESVDLGLIITPRPMEEAEQPTTLQQTTAPPEHSAVTPFHPGPAQAQQPTPPAIAVESVDLGLTITPRPMEEAEQPTTLQQTTAPPEHPAVALSYLGAVQSRQPTLPGVMEGTKSLQPGPSERVPPMTENKATRSVCQLCSCRNETLSCVALDSTQRLHSVPVLQPGIDKDTFTTLDLRGNAIVSLSENSWQSFHHIEKLILSGNEITELRENSFKGLLSLKYLDLSCNKIQFIEKNTFESLPFLQHLNLSCNSLEKLSLETFKAWHGMQFLYKIILDQNPLTTIEDPNLLKLPALKYLDLGTTEVSLKTVETIIMKTHELEKLILPSRLSCCLCQLKNDIEAVSKTIKLHCEAECVVNTPCEELSTAKAALLDAVRSHRESTSTELTIEPEKTSPETLGNMLSNLMRLLKKLLKGKEQVEVPKEEWETGQLVNTNTNAQDEEEEQESSEMKTELPSYLLNKKLIVAIPISVAAMMFIFLLCLILICHRFAKEREGSSRSSPESEMEAGGVWSRRPLGLKNVYRPLTTIWKKNMVQRLHDESSDEDESPDKMDEGELTEVRIEGSESAAEDTGEERES
ncbi:leucine-rich repeat-containing protein 37A2-like [Saccopteryx leptura]|uniref:leucine-rich repeat-containing protein 37A2-like n=1 Tax=Saccopteryx leptura TaxID=249018 RepID=UPI00339BAB7C